MLTPKETPQRRGSHNSDEGDNMKRLVGKIAAALMAPFGVALTKMAEARISRICVRRATTVLAGLAVFWLEVVAIPSANGQSFSVLHSFTNLADGANPLGSLIMDQAGNLYGTTLSGGCTAYGCGTVFQVDPAGNETILYNFGRVSSGYDPGDPYAALVMDQAGNLYGTTRDGGQYGFGTVFELDTSSNFTVLHSFTLSEGADPYAGLVMDQAGNLYGTASGGGACGLCGTVFELDTSGNLTVLHNFTGPDGISPYGGLVMDQAGNLYGTTGSGGSGACPVGPFFAPCGTVFKLDTSGNLAVLHNFTGGDGAYPYAGLFMDNAGNLYGTTQAGGSGNCGGQFNIGGCGTVFMLDASGNFTVLFSFTGIPGDGAYPYAGLIMDNAGNLYGTTQAGGPGACTGRNAALIGCGTVFELDTSGNETVLYNFTGGDDGAFPWAGLVMDQAGNLYGTASAGAYGTTSVGGPCIVVGGWGGCGTVFELQITPSGGAQGARRAVQRSN
jgi:uncharacterized repeat protein (TIGR03803 family)